MTFVASGTMSAWLVPQDKKIIGTTLCIINGLLQVTTVKPLKAENANLV